MSLRKILVNELKIMQPFWLTEDDHEKYPDEGYFISTDLHMKCCHDGKTLDRTLEHTLFVVVE